MCAIWFGTNIHGADAPARLIMLNPISPPTFAAHLGAINCDNEAARLRIAVLAAILASLSSL